jgi:hypothetical protein
MAVLFDQGVGLSKEVWVGRNGNPNYGQEVVDFFSFFWKKKKILMLDWRFCFR